MSFKVTSVYLQEVYPSLMQLIRETRNELINYRKDFVATGSDYHKLRQLFLSMRNKRTRLNVDKQIPGLVQYAQTQQDDVTYNIVAEFNTAMPNLQAIINRLILDMPKGPGDLVLGETWTDANGVTPRAFTPSELSALVTAIDKFLGTLT